MSADAMLLDAVSRVLLDHYNTERLQVAKREGWSAALWETLAQTGMTLLGVPEEAGGGGGEFADAIEVLRLAGKYCAAVPFAETALLAGWALAAAGMPVPGGPLAFAVAPHMGELRVAEAGGGQWHVTGVLREVAWAGAAAGLVVVAAYAGGALVMSVPRDGYAVETAVNLAGESRDLVRLEAVRLPAAAVRHSEAAVTAEKAWRRGALTRAVLMSGALDRALELTLAYTKQRVQFGRTLIKFQAVQQELARLAGEAAIAKAIALSAAARLDAEDAELYVAAAKVKAGEAAQSGAMIAHQLHGAIGVTDEYLLHHTTLRLWAWRTEYGSEAHWAAQLGHLAVSAGSQGLWARLTES